jgi:primosomal protein N' (replication factor Y)
MADVRVVNMRDEMAVEGPDVVLSRVLRDALEDRLARGEQSLVLLNRRGFATAVVCRQCGTMLDCPNCSVSLTVHTRGDEWRARCHYCNFGQRVPRACTKCAAPYLERIGFGTERIEAEIRSLFPAARVSRVDRDSVRRRGSLVDLLNRFARREIDVMVGTQMIAKGHDFPDVTLVGVIAADVGLGLADFRAAERTFQLLTQVAGRAGRGERPGLAIIQSLVPEHYGIRLACAQDYRRFYEREIEFRHHMRYPPHVAMVNVVVRGRSFAQAMQDARELADATRGAAGFVVLGPAPAPLTRLRGEHRAQFFLKGTSRARMREALQAAIASHPDIARRASVDVDPLSML